MALVLHNAQYLRGFDCAAHGCTRRELHVHCRDLKNGQVLVLGTGGLPAFQFGTHVILCQPHELEDYELGLNGELVDLAAAGRKANAEP